MDLLFRILEQACDDILLNTRFLGQAEVFAQLLEACRLWATLLNQERHEFMGRQSALWSLDMRVLIAEPLEGEAAEVLFGAWRVLPTGPRIFGRCKLVRGSGLGPWSSNYKGRRKVRCVGHITYGRHI